MKESRFSLQLKAEFYYLTAIANIYPMVHSRGWIAISILTNVVAYSWIVSTIIMTAYTTILVKDRLAFLSQTLHMLIVGASTIFAALSISLNRKKAERFEKLFCEPESFVSYAESEYFQELKKEGYKKKDWLLLFWFGMYGSCGLIGVLQGTIDFWAGVANEGQNVNGVWTNLPFVMWFPWDLENDITMWLIVYAYEAGFMLWCVVKIVTAIVICFSVSGKILDQVRLNVWAIKNLDLRAEELFKQRYPQGEIKDMLKEYDDCFYDCVIKNVEHHLIIKSEYDAFRDIASLALAVPSYGGALMLGMALITISATDDPRVGPKYLAGMMAISETINLYNLCKVGQDLQDISLEISEALFYTKWHKHSKKCAKAIMIMKYGASRPLKLVAAHMLTLNLGFFADLVNSAYSIFNLKAASKE